MSSRWLAGVTGAALTELTSATAGSRCIFTRMLMLLEEDLESSIRKLAKDEVCQSHGLISKEIGRQQAMRSQIDMINQIIKEK